MYIILELVSGGELFDRIKTAKRLPEDAGRYYFQQIMLGLNYCHKHGIAHRCVRMLACMPFLEFGLPFAFTLYPLCLVDNAFVFIFVPTLFLRDVSLRNFFALRT